MVDDPNRCGRRLDWCGYDKKCVSSEAGVMDHDDLGLGIWAEVDLYGQLHYGHAVGNYIGRALQCPAAVNKTITILYSLFISIEV